MADVTLAECNGNIWLVSGEQYIHQLLFNTMPSDVTVELISCDNKQQVHNLWLQNCGTPDSPRDPIMIHPRIADRVRRSKPGRTVFFTQWSAMLDEDALAVLRAAAAWMVETPALQAVLVEYVDPQGMAGLAELSKVRLTLIREKLAEFGVVAERISVETRMPGDTVEARQDSQRVDMMISES